MTSVVLHPRHPPGMPDALQAIGVDVVVPFEDEIPAALEDSGILVSFRWDDSFLPPLRWLQSISAGHDQFPYDAFRQHGVVLTSASGVHAPQVAEHAMALLLALTRGIGFATRNAVEHRWVPIQPDELTGRTVGVLGLGTIGEEIARRCHAWGLRVIGTKGHPDAYDGVAELVVGAEETGRVFEEADVVISVLPGGAGTDGLVTRQMLESLDGWFVNVGRGNVVSEGDILGALDSGGLRGAGLDVFAEEPLPDDSPLWSHRRVVLTPHTAGLSPEYAPRLAAIVRENLAAFAGDGEWVNRVV